MIQTNITFKTKELNIFLSILDGITNTIFNFSLSYTFISFKVIKAFKFINIYYKKLFLGRFSKTYQILGNILLNLGVAMIRQVGMIIVKTRIS